MEFSLFDTVAIGIAGAVAVVALLLELRRDLMMMQQNSYRPERYRRWLNTAGEYTSWLRLLLMLTFMMMAAFGQYGILFSVMALLLLFVALRLATARYKKPLVWTPRARRIYGTALAEVALLLAAVWLVADDDKWLIAAIAVVPLYIVSHEVVLVAVWLLTPVEARINRGYYDDAARRLRSMPDLRVVGITGSYGKTSTKHYLHRILQEQWETLMTPGSYNTTMGVVRTVREQLKPYTEIFICEMGAKQPGDIREICDLVRPTIGIITAVGEQHLESFRTLENVQRTKFELADALPADGFVLINNDFPYAASRKVSNTTALRYSIGNADADYRATDIAYGREGTSFTLHTPDGGAYPFRTRLLGEHNISNLVAAIAVALRLGMSAESIGYAVGRIEPVEHRLSMKQAPGGITILDDAFNSNPVGARMALDVLSAMKGGKRIIVTPGMIELGERQYDANKELGSQIARCADMAIVVGEYNRDALLSGLRDAKMPEERVRAVATFAQAQHELAPLLAPGDTVLYENDLPDTFK